MERKPEKDAVRIGELSRLTGVHVATLRRWADSGRIPFVREDGGHRYFDAAAVSEILACSPVTERAALGEPSWASAESLEGLAEHEVWARACRELGLDSARPAVHIVEYAFSEMLNNAIDHSAGSSATVKLWTGGSDLAFEIADDGIGAFERFRSSFGLPDHLTALQQLSKGKVTSAPAEHSGQGIFFTSKALDLFRLDANDLAWEVDNRIGDQAVGSARTGTGTRVFGLVDAASERTMTQVFGAYSIGEEFARNRTAIKLFQYGASFVSRSQAKSVMDGLERFSEVELDFAGVDMVGQGFVDEAFRVWPSAHPETRVTYSGANAGIRFMVERGLA